ncbi:unnamed protein product [Dibothriocephalus latus]|uniref:UTP25 C-terminal domain-containing protein n=1 Tax=Dibothriocephalus latus TaxID=60516 RepID=A0A3P7N599_DIBLA|nr:unnamed protein product [Dibothriocephalus latus]
MRRGIDQRVLIYVPDYFDLEELRNLLREESLSFCHVHEYLPDNEAERYRNLFDQGRIRIMLISERYYFFRRYVCHLPRCSRQFFSGFALFNTLYPVFKVHLLFLEVIRQVIGGNTC